MLHKSQFDYFFDNNRDVELLMALQSVSQRVEQIAQVLAMHLPATDGMLRNFTSDIYGPIKRYQGSDAASILAGRGPLGRRVLESITLQENLFARPLEPGFTYGWRISYEEAFVKKVTQTSDHYAAISEFKKEFSSAVKLLKRSSKFQLEPIDDFGLGISAEYDKDNAVEFYYTHPFERLTFYWDGVVVGEVIDRMIAEFWKEHSDIRDADFSAMEKQLCDLAAECGRKIYGDAPVHSFDLRNSTLRYQVVKIEVVFLPEREGFEAVSAVHYAQKGGDSYHHNTYSAVELSRVERWKIITDLTEGMREFLDTLEESKQNQGEASDHDHALAYFTKCLGTKRSYHLFTNNK